MGSGIFSSTLAAVQASLSVLLVITYGALSCKWGLLNHHNGKAISKICVKMFLPALLIVQIGSELQAHSAQRYMIVLIWAFVCHAISFGMGIAAHYLWGLPDWTTAAIMFNNTTSYPLLLIQSLDETGILERLVLGGDGTGRAIERSKSYFLVFATVSSCLTFAVGPRLIDSENAPDGDVEDDPKAKVFEEYDDDERVDEMDVDPEVGESRYRDMGSPNENTRLLGVPSSQHRYRQRLGSVTSITFFPSKPKFTTVTRRPFYIPRPKWSDFGPRTKWWLLFFYDFLNAPLLGAVLGTIIGLTPPLHKVLFNDTYNGGIFSAWLTESLRNIGGLFVPLPLIVAGISLYTSYQESREAGTSSRTNVPWTTMGFILAVRFIVWPVLSIGMIYAIVKNSGGDGILGNDPMLWFAMMLMPTGPPAMKLITMVQVSDAGVEDERRIAKILTISYIVSPVLAFTVVGALRASQAAL